MKILGAVLKVVFVQSLLISSISYGHFGPKLVKTPRETMPLVVEIDGELMPIEVAIDVWGLGPLRDSGPILPKVLSEMVTEGGATIWLKTASGLTDVTRDYVILANLDLSETKQRRDIEDRVDGEILAN